MIAVVFSKIDKLPKFVSSDYGNSNSICSDSVFIQRAIEKNGGSPTDYYVYKTNDETIKQRVFRQDECHIDEKSDSISFDIEDQKKWIQFKTDSPDNSQRLYLDGTSNELFLTATMLLSDKVTLDSDFNDTVKLFITNPSGKIIPIRGKFTNGIHSQRFYPSEFGYYVIPEDVFRCAKNKYRVIEQLKIEVYYQG